MPLAQLEAVTNGIANRNCVTEPGTLVTACFQLEEQAEPHSSQVSLSQVAGRRKDGEKVDSSKQWVYSPEEMLRQLERP